MSIAQCGTFAVHSGGLCFGPLLDIHYASRIPIQPPPLPEPHLSGTVKMHDIIHNVPAQFGNWRTYPLSSTTAPYDVTGWFAAHEDVDPKPELVKLLHVAGSPYEYDDGNSVNNQETRNESVLLVNRYDWRRPQDDVSQEFPDAWVKWNKIGDSSAGYWDCIGLVDYAYAAEKSQLWSKSAPKKRKSTAHGAWLHIPLQEYMWARIGFDDDYTIARSFLYFNIHTNFFKTSFPGETTPVRIFETELERYERGIREGRDYSGLKDFNELAPRYYDPGLGRKPIPVPIDAEMLGPYPKEQHLFTMEDFEFIAKRSMEPIPPPIPKDLSVEQTKARKQSNVNPYFSVPHRDEILDLLNELALVLIERIVPLLQSEGGVIYSQPLPDYQKQGSLDQRIFKCLRSGGTSYPYKPRIFPKLMKFCRERTPDAPIDPKSIDGLVDAVVYFLQEIIWEGDIRAIGLGDARAEGVRPIIVPASIRPGLYVDLQLAAHTRFSRVLWKGRTEAE